MKWLSDKTDPGPIDWGKPNWVRLKSKPNFIILTTGEHSGKQFTGMCLPCESVPEGEFMREWNKDQFELVPGTVMFPISNEI